MPTALYSLLLVNETNTAFAKALQSDVKGKASIGLYFCAIGISLVSPIIAEIVFVAVAALWIIPDRGFEPAIADRRAAKDRA